MMLIERKGFIKGQEVEVASEEEGFEDSWYVATVLGKSFARNKYKIKYHSLLNDDETQPLIDYVEIYNIRPIPPKETVRERRLFEIDQIVDAYLNDGWWKGFINGVVIEGLRYSVFFPPTKEVLEFDQKDLRTHLDWIDGKWVCKNQVLFEETAIADSYGSVLETNLTGSSVCSMDTDISQIPCAVRKNLWKDGVTLSKYKQGRKDESITDAIDSPRDGLVSSRKYMKHSAHKSNAEVERPLKMLTYGEATETTPCPKTWNSKGTSTRSKIDSPYVLSLSSTPGKREKFQNRCAVTPISSESSPQLHLDVIEAEHSEVIGVVTQTNVLEKEQGQSSGSDRKQKRVRAADNQTMGPTRKRGRPAASGKKQEREIRKPLALGTAFQPLGPENGFSINEVTDAQTECTPLLGDIADEHQPLSMFLSKSSSDVMKGIEGMVDKQIVNVFKRNSDQTKGSSKKASVIGPAKEYAKKVKAVVQKDCTLSMNHIAEEHQLHSQILQRTNSCTGQDVGGLEHEAAREELSVRKECTIVTTTAEVCQPLSPCSEKSKSLALDENGGVLPDNQRVLNKAMNQIDVSTESLVPLDSSNVARSSLPHTTFEDNNHCNNVSGDERELHLVDITANTCSSPLDESLPFVKHQYLWTSFESLEVFQRMPQKPHFRPLEKYDEEIREGYAVANMMNFANLVQNTLEAKIDEPRSVYESRLKRLTELEEHGFTVQPIRLVLEGILKLKASCSEIDDKTKEAEREFVEEKAKLDEVDDSIKQLNIKLQALQKDREMISSAVAARQRKVTEIQESSQSFILDFKNMVASMYT